MKIYLGDVDIKSHVNMKMHINTFDALCAKELNGFRAWVTGKISFTGSLGTVQKWDSEVNLKYLENLDKEVCLVGLD